MKSGRRRRKKRWRPAELANLLACRRQAGLMLRAATRGAYLSLHEGDNDDERTVPSLLIKPDRAAALQVSHKNN